MGLPGCHMTSANAIALSRAERNVDVTVACQVSAPLVSVTLDRQSPKNRAAPLTQAIAPDFVRVEALDGECDLTFAAAAN